MNHHLISLLNLLKIMEKYKYKAVPIVKKDRFIPISPFDKQKPEITAFSMKRPFGQK